MTFLCLLLGKKILQLAFCFAVSIFPLQCYPFLPCSGLASILLRTVAFRCFRVVLSGACGLLQSCASGCFRVCFKQLEAASGCASGCASGFERGFFFASGRGARGFRFAARWCFRRRIPLRGRLQGAASGFGVCFRPEATRRSPFLVRVSSSSGGVSFPRHRPRGWAGRTNEPI